MHADVVVIGAGIVGLAAARALLDISAVGSILVVDKEHRVAMHQSGRNSGVIHSGIYYPAGSAKASMVATGRRELMAFCRRHGIRHEICGKVVIATEPHELPGLHELERRARDNRIAVDPLGPTALADLEPHATGVAGLLVPSTGIVDFGEVCQALATEIEASGRARLLLGQPVVEIHERSDAVHATTPLGEIRSRWLVNCGGLHSDQLSARARVPTGNVRIIAFRGEYHDLVPGRRHLVRNIIYPVPDPRFPFLGVHLTRALDGSVHAGPNAVAALEREGYRWRDIDPHEVSSLVTSPAARALARRYWRTGATEVVRSLSTTVLARSLRRLVPEIQARDLRRGRSGVRAQAVTSDGRLVDDFVFAESRRIVSVVNAPSPAATASLELGRAITRRLSSRL